jgi:hypothetical protein
LVDLFTANLILQRSSKADQSGFFLFLKIRTLVPNGKLTLLRYSSFGIRFEAVGHLAREFLRPRFCLRNSK